MKEIRVEVPQNQIEVIEDFLGSFQIKTSQLALQDGGMLFILKVEDNRSNNLLHELKARGVGDVFGEISLIDLSLHMSSSSSTSKIQKSAAANLEEILATLEESATISGSYIALVLLSGALAAFGLLSDSIVIIIGSMIVAPLMGPIALTSIGVLLPQRGLFEKGLAAEAVGILFTVAVGFFVGIVWAEPDPIPKQMLIRADPQALDVIFAVISAIAAGMIISKGQSLSIVGVAIAASLAPPAANIGLFLAYNDMESAELAGILLLINILAINASCSIMFTIFRLPTKAGMSKRRVTRIQKMNRLLMTIVALTFIALSVFIIIRET
ncbi:MAG: TIGR00341 family protein [Candidatus Kariarchaeaceae archaeon]